MSRPALKLAGAYAFVALLWIYLTDRLSETLFAETGPLAKAMTFKGFFFVLVTSVILFFFTRRMINRYRESQRRFQLLFDKAPQAYQSLDTEGRIQEVNETLLETLGYEYDLVMGRPFSDFLAGESATRFPEQFRSFKERGRIRNVEFSMVRRDGTTIDVAFDGRIGYDERGRMRQTHCIFRDITRRKATERALRESEEKYRTIVQHSLSGIVIVQQGVVVFSNLQLATVFGFDEPEQIIGKELADVVADEELEQVRQSISSIEPDESRHLVFRGVRADGSTFQAEAVFGALEYQGALATLGSLHDISLQHELEKQLRQAQKMEAVGRLAGGVAHDFNNLLTAVLGNVELAQMDMDDRGTVQGCLEEIERITERASGLTRQLLTFSRQRAVEVRDQQLGTIVHDLQKMLQRLISEDVNLEFEIEEDAWTVRADAGQLEQVLVNLVVNARDAMQSGGRITVRVFNEHVEPTRCFLCASTIEGDFAVLEVQDEGVGMSRAELERVFEPFYTTKPEGKGTGLGLSTVYGIVTSFHGHLQVESEKGVGTRFRILFPRAEVSGDNGEPLRESSGVLEGQERVLLIEDDDAVRTAVSRTLKTHGYRVITAANGREAIAAAREYGDVNLIVSDIVLPEIEGPEVVRRLQADMPGVRVLFMSGYAPDAVNLNDIVPAASFLRKPFTTRALLSRVRGVLDAEQPAPSRP